MILDIRQVLGDRPFAEIGAATLVVNSPELIAVAGTPGHATWFGREVTGGHRVGVYLADTARCLHLLHLSHPVRTMAFHPDLPLVAIGSGDYDGGYSWDGELTLLDLESGRTVSLLAGTREVVRVRWLDGQSLEVVMSVANEDDEEALGTGVVRQVVDRVDWRTAEADSVAADGEPTTFEPEQTNAEAALSRVAPTRTPRRQVWSVDALHDGRVVAALEHVLAECWTAAGERAWVVPTPGTGRQLFVAPDGRTATATTSSPDWREPWTKVDQVDLTDGTVRPMYAADHGAVVSTDRDGRVAVRNTDGGNRVLVLGDREFEVGRYDLFNHYFDIRRAPTLLFLKGTGGKPHLDKWVVTLDKPLFPLEWAPTLDRHLFGGPGVFVDDAIVHGGAVHDSRGLLPGNAFVVRRRYPDGRAEWSFDADHKVTAVDVLGDVVYAAFTNGEVVALDVFEGKVLGRQHLTVHGRPVVPLSLGAREPDTLLIGTMDGRILVTTPRTTPRRRG